MALLERPKKAFLNLFRGTCPGCGAPMDPNGPTLCRWCSIRIYTDGERILQGRRILTGFHHSGVPREMIIRLKFGGERKLAPVLAALALAGWRERPEPGDTVVPVPSAPGRIRKRGYCQAALIARAAAASTGAWYREVLKRSRGSSQVGLSAAERTSNIKGKFSCRAKTDIQGRTWLVDDVMTTGSTILECLAVLGDAGIDEVVPAVVCFRRPEDESIIQGKEVNHGGF